jgi:hypothetical protein
MCRILAAMKEMQVVSLTSPLSNCNAVPVVVRSNVVYVGCYAEGVIEEFDVSNPAAMVLSKTIAGIAYPESFDFSGDDLLVTGAVAGGHVYEIDTDVTQ